MERAQSTSGVVRHNASQMSCVAILIWEYNRIWSRDPSQKVRPNANYIYLMEKADLEFTFMLKGA